MQIEVNPFTRLAQHTGDIRKVILALLIIGLDLLQCVEEPATIKTVNAGIDLANLELVIAGIALLDNAHQLVDGNVFDRVNLPAGPADFE